jgi:acyl carrier protein
VVIVREDTPGDKRLVAYVVPRPGPGVRAHELRTYLKGRLPEYMVPAAFVTLDALPLTPSGKVDRNALPTPDLSWLAAEDTFVAPRTPDEETLAEIWADVLRLDRVGIHDNFFEVGGHSLSATRVISRIRDSFHVEVPLRSMFEAPTIAALAMAIAQMQASSAERQASALHPVSREAYRVKVSAVPRDAGA